MTNDILTQSFIDLRDRLHRSALGFLRNEEDAADALQDTFFRLWKSGAVATDSEARNKLFAVLRNVCIDRLRKPRTAALDERHMDDIAEPPPGGEELGRLEVLITSGLSETQRRIYVMVTHAGVEYEEIALRLGMSVEAVRVSMSRARKKIRDNYKKLDR